MTQPDNIDSVPLFDRNTVIAQMTEGEETCLPSGRCLTACDLRETCEEVSERRARWAAAGVEL